MLLEIRPITLRDANVFVAQYHRHNMPTSGHKFSVACYDGDRLCGVAIAGQPIARKLDDGLTLEIRRVCTDGTRNACSMLYGACSRCAREMGYKRVVTYTLVSESGASLRAAGFKDCGEAGGGHGICHRGRGRNIRRASLALSASTRTRRRSDGRRGISKCLSMETLSRSGTAPGY